MTQTIPILVISLANVPERRASMDAHLGGFGLNYEIVEAVDGRLMSEDERTALVQPGLAYHPGVVGCYISHLKAYQTIVDRCLPLALILEDDARINPDFVTVIRNGLDFDDFDYCLLDCEDNSEGVPVFFDKSSKTQLAPGFNVYVPSMGPALLHAYLMSLEGARRRLRDAFPIRAPIDVHSRLSYRPKIVVVLDPKGANVSVLSRQSYTSGRHETAPLRFRWLRQFEIFSKLREWIRLKPFKGLIQARYLIRQGRLERGRKWRRLPPGRMIREI